MPTTVHLPRDLLSAVDRRARRLKLSRNRLIVRALERELAQNADWSPGFFEELAGVERGDVEAVEDLLQAIRSRRSSKEPRAL
jgi:predicted transcriptional regulator